MLAGLTVQHVTFFIILIAAFVLLLTGRLRNDLVAILIILSLALTGLLSPEEALAGFSSEPAIVVAAIFVLTGALELTGVSETLGHWIGRAAGRTFTRAIAVIMPAVALLSAFTHHVTTTAIMLPVCVGLCKERDIPQSKLLMPLSFAASLGTTITIIGAPAFLVASAALERTGRDGLGIFSIAPIGLVLSAAGTALMIVAGRFLLPERSGGALGAEHLKLESYYTELTILPDSRLVGKTLGEAADGGRFTFEVKGWRRNGKSLKRKLDQEVLQEGDVLMVNATPEDLVAIRSEPGIDLTPVHEYVAQEESAGAALSGETDITEQLVQAVISPSARIIGRTLGKLDFRNRYGAVVVGIYRQNGYMRKGLADERLRAGDVLVIQGDEEALARLQDDPDFLMLVPFQGEARLRRKALLAALIMLGTVALAGFNVVGLAIAALAGAAAVVLTGCMTPRQAYSAVDQRIFVFIAGAIPLGAAMEATGASALLASWLQGLVASWSPFWILMVIFLIVSLITQLMSDAATTALFAPVAVALARQLGLAPEPFVVTVAMAAVASFWTPIGHHGNLLVYGPGRYEFKDFLIVGGLLTVVVAFIVVSMAPLLWPYAAP